MRQPPPPIGWRSVLVMAVVGGVTLQVIKYRRDKQMNSMKDVKTIGTPSVGGPFSLTDQFGKIRTEKDFFGNFTLIYFGFTHCPDICPTELKKIEQTLKILDDRGVRNIVPLFISVDPKRDNPKRLLEHSHLYDNRFVWLTGSEKEVSSVAKSFRVYYSAEQKDSENYNVDHSIFLYFMDTSGRLVEIFGKSLSASEVATKISAHVRRAREMGISL